jgi:hypothetical protein
MKVFTDGLFKIGSTHKVCQDYVHHGQDFLPFAVVSDGCSGSNNSDIGSRILAHSFEQVMKLIGREKIITYPAKSLAARVQSYAYSNIANLGIDESSLHATLLFAVANEEQNKLRVTMIGDGVFAYKLKSSDQPAIVKSDFSHDYPVYPGYFNNNELMHEYERVNLEVGQEVTHTWIQGSQPEGYLPNKCKYIFNIVLPLDEIEWAMLSSDGIDTFVGEAFPNEAQNTKDLVLPYFSAIKARQGEFVTRRINKMLNKELSGFIHEDDLSVAGISFI